MERKKTHWIKVKKDIRRGKTLENISISFSFLQSDNDFWWMKIKYDKEGLMLIQFLWYLSVNYKSSDISVL